MRKFLLLTICLVSNTLLAQDLSFSKPGKNYYKELPNPVQTPLSEWAKVTGEINVSFANDNVRYPKEQVPVVASKEWATKAWKGEKVLTQILVWTKKYIPELSCQTGELSDGKGHIIKSENIKAAFVRYVMTDEFGGGCDERTPGKYDSSLVEDPIDIIDKLQVQANTTQPIWLSVKVPGDIPSGKYTGSVTISANQEKRWKLVI